MIELVKLHHVSFGVRDVEASRRFFSGVIGLKEIERPAFGFPGAWYAVGDRQLHLIEQAEAGGDRSTPTGRADHMALEVEDLSAVRRTLGEAGIDFGDGGNRALGFDQVFCRDPDGHMIEFIQPL